MYKKEFNDMLEESLKEHAETWRQLAMTLRCGGCVNNTTIDSPHSCIVCGRMLCGECGDLCIDHAWDEEDEASS